MSFGEELCNLSFEATNNSAKEVWDAIKKVLKDIAKETGESGCNVFFLNIPNRVTEILEVFAQADEIEFKNWNSSSEEGHPGKPYEQIGIITWNSSVFFKEYPTMVSRYYLEVLDDDGINVRRYDRKLGDAM